MWTFLNNFPEMCFWKATFCYESVKKNETNKMCWFGSVLNHLYYGLRDVLIS